MQLNHSEDYYIRALLNKVKLKEIMSSPAISVSVHAPFREVARLLQQHRIRHLPIVNSANEVVGLMTERDLYKIQPPHKLEDGTWTYDWEILDGVILQNVMIPYPFTLSTEDTVAAAVTEMVRKKYGCVPVVDAGKTLCGIVTQYDILKIAVAILQE